MSMMIFIWFIGHWFSIGFVLEESNSKEGFLGAILLLFFWPLLLGCFVRDCLVGNE